MAISYNEKKPSLTVTLAFMAQAPNSPSRAAVSFLGGGRRVLRLVFTPDKRPKTSADFFEIDQEYWDVNYVNPRKFLSASPDYCRENVDPMDNNCAQVVIDYEDSEHASATAATLNRFVQVYATGHYGFDSYAGVARPKFSKKFTAKRALAHKLHNSLLWTVLAVFYSELETVLIAGQCIASNWHRVMRLKPPQKIVPLFDYTIGLDISTALEHLQIAAGYLLRHYASGMVADMYLYHEPIDVAYFPKGEFKTRQSMVVDIMQRLGELNQLKKELFSFARGDLALS